jgi:hypothetical protein
MQIKIPGYCYMYKKLLESRYVLYCRRREVNLIPGAGVATVHLALIF